MKLTAPNMAPNGNQNTSRKKTRSVELKKSAPAPLSFFDARDAVSHIFEYLDDDKSKINFTMVEKYCNEVLHEKKSNYSKI